MPAKHLTFGSLFSGIGAIDLGLERAGIECRWQVEIEPYCIRVLEKHWPAVKRHGDITKIEGSELERVDIICGGYPCQPFSQAGQRKGSEDARHLWPEFARIIRLLRPRYVLLENVPGHLSLGFGDVLGDLAGLGFDAEWTCVRAADVGASHLRKRVFVVAYRNSGGFGWPNFEDEINRPIPQGGPRRGVCEAGDNVADTEHAERRTEYQEHTEPHGRARSGWGCNQLGNATVPRFGAGREFEAGRGGLADAERAGLEIGDGKREQHARQDAESLTPGLPFAPGPNDPRWGTILRERPDLAPALESPVRGVAHGLPDWVDRALSNRTKRLKALGNAVVPQVAHLIGRCILTSPSR